MKKVAIYLRVSTDEQVQNGNGLEIQEEALKNYVSSQGYTLDEKHIFVDEGKSGAQKEDRPALRNMLESAQRNEFEIVLVWKVDRFFRKTLYLLEGIETLEKMGVGFISITQPFDTTQAFGKMMLQMMGVIAELERELIKERTFNGILSSMKKGKWGRGNTPYGYRKNDEGYLIIEKQEEKIIQMVFRMLVKDGLTTSEITRKLNDMNIETYGSKGGLGKGRQKEIKHKNLWQKSAVQKILHNEVYIGKLIQNRYRVQKGKRTEKPESEWIVGNSPRIISDELFGSAQKILLDNQKFSRRCTKKKNTYMLAKLIECKETGYKYVGYMSTKGTKNYKINVNKTKVANFEKIGSRGISGNQIDTVVWSELKRVLLHPQVLQKELEDTRKISHTKQKGIKEEILLLEESLLKIQDNSKGLLQMVSSMDESSVELVQSQLRENEEKTKEIKSKKSELESQLGDTDKILAQVNDFSHISDIVRDNLDNLSYETKTEICKLLIKRIIFDGVHVEIELTVPISPKRRKLLPENHAGEFFKKSDGLLKTKLTELKQDFETGVEMIKNLRTYYYQVSFI